jgi:SAM-dependent methyltransferase
VYSASDNFVWHLPHVEHDDKYVSSHYPYSEEGTGRRYGLWDITGPGGAAKGNPRYEVFGITKYWRYSQENMEKKIAAGKVIQPNPGSIPREVRYLDESRGAPIGTLWTDINPINSQAIEDSGYPTQKPEALLERIITMSSDEGQLVLDCFCGSGTTAVVAEKLGRRWIACDLSRFGVHTARKRLLSTADVRPFIVQNLGRYERQLWQAAEFGDSAAARTAAYRAFILDLYHATPVSGHAWLHGLKQGRMVHVGTVDAPVTVGDVKQIVVEFRKVIGTGESAPKEQSVDILGWDFAFELNEVARQDAERAGIDLRLVRIPREVLDKRAVEQGDVRFFELAALAVGVTQSGRWVKLSIDDFVIPLDDVPDDVQKAVSHWAQWIDYWAVDWDNKDDTFHNEWQVYRTRTSRDLSLTTEHEYAAPGDYLVVVKVIDILGNDTTKTLSLKVTGRAS